MLNTKTTMRYGVGNPGPDRHANYVSIFLLGSDDSQTVIIYQTHHSIYK
jgi:hypothetical protein